VNKQDLSHEFTEDENDFSESQGYNEDSNGIQHQNALFSDFPSEIGEDILVDQSEPQPMATIHEFDEFFRSFFGDSLQLNTPSVQNNQQIDDEIKFEVPVSPVHNEDLQLPSPIGIFGIESTLRNDHEFPIEEDDEKNTNVRCIPLGTCEHQQFHLVKRHAKNDSPLEFPHNTFVDYPFIIIYRKFNTIEIVLPNCALNSNPICEIKEFDLRDHSVENKLSVESCTVSSINYNDNNNNNNNDGNEEDGAEGNDIVRTIIQIKITKESKMKKQVVDSKKGPNKLSNIYLLSIHCGNVTVSKLIHVYSRCRENLEIVTRKAISYHQSLLSHDVSFSTLGMWYIYFNN